MPRRRRVEKSGPCRSGELRNIGDRFRAAGPSQLEMFGAVGVDREVIGLAVQPFRRGVHESVLRPHARVMQFRLVTRCDEWLSIITMAEPRSLRSSQF